MNRPLETFALRKQLLVARSSLCRLKIRHEVEVMRESLTWRRAGSAVAGSLPVSSAVFLIAAGGLGHGRMARWLAFAGRALAIARLASLAATLMRDSRAGPPGRPGEAPDSPGPQSADGNPRPQSVLSD